MSIFPNEQTVSFSENDKLNVLRNLSQKVGNSILGLQNLHPNINELCEWLVNEGLIIKGKDNNFFLTEKGETHKQILFQNFK